MFPDRTLRCSTQLCRSWIRMSLTETAARMHLESTVLWAEAGSRDSKGEGPAGRDGA